MSTSAFFIYATVVQFNDVDAGIWIAVYGLAAAIAAVATFERPKVADRELHVLAGMLAVVCTVWAATLVPAAIAAPVLLDSEEGRECLGLTIVAVFAGGITLARRGARGLTHT